MAGGLDGHWTVWDLTVACLCSPSSLPLSLLLPLYRYSLRLFSAAPSPALVCFDFRRWHCVARTPTVYSRGADASPPPACLFYTSAMHFLRCTPQDRLVLPLWFYHQLDRAGRGRRLLDGADAAGAFYILLT